MILKGGHSFSLLCFRGGGGGLWKISKENDIEHRGGPTIFFLKKGNENMYTIQLFPSGSVKIYISYNYSPQGRCRAVDIYLDALRLGIYPPLFTSPSLDSCIIYIYMCIYTTFRD